MYNTTRLLLISKWLKLTKGSPKVLSLNNVNTTDSKLKMVDFAQLDNTWKLQTIFFKSIFFNSSFRLFPLFYFSSPPIFRHILFLPTPHFLFISLVSRPHTRQEKYVLRLLRTALTSLNSTNMQTHHTAMLYCPTSEQPRYSRTSSKWTIPQVNKL